MRSSSPLSRAVDCHLQVGRRRSCLCRHLASVAGDRNLSRGVSWRKSSSRENASLIGDSRIWAAISASTRTFSNSGRCPKLPPVH